MGHQAEVEKQRHKFFRIPARNGEGPLVLLLSVIVTLALLVVLMPRETKFGYAYEKGRPWHYASLIAQYDFPIYKSDARLQADRDSAMAGFQPIFQQTDSMAYRQGRHLLSDWQAGRYKGVPYSHVAHVGRLLETIYAQGVMSNEHMSRVRDYQVTSVRIVNGTQAHSAKVNDIYTPLAAYEYIMHADTVHFQRQELARMELSQYLQPSLEYDSLKTKRARADLLASVSQTLGMVQSGQKIIDRGEIVTDETCVLLDSFRRESELRKDDSSNLRYLLCGQIGTALMIILLFVAYLALFRKDVVQSPHHVMLLFSLLLFFPGITYLMVSHNIMSIYIVPFSMAPIFVRIFIDSRTAAMHLLTMVLLASLGLHQPFNFVMTEMVAGLIAIYSLRELTARSQIFRSALAVTVGSILFGVFLDFTQGATLSNIDLSLLFYKVVCGVLLVFTYALMYLVERLFGFTSDVTLVELNSGSHPLLRQMSKVAQGTFIHSMQVANLAVEVATKIGAQTQLVRTGALYHDIGKMASPAFFTENQAGTNPHDQLTEEQSASIIISHVTEGVKLAAKHNLPEEVREFILTHHGQSRVGYFYIQAVNRRGEERVNPDDYTYPGRNPYTREQAILMMTDAVEAASRSLKEYTEENIQELVNRIIDGQLKAGYFSQCPISFRDIEQAKGVLCESLKTIYHTRISYPEAANGQRQKEEVAELQPAHPGHNSPAFRTTAFGAHHK